MPELTAPQPLNDAHELEAFDSGEETLDTWLRRHARRNEQEGGPRTFVVCAGQRAVGYYGLATSSILPGTATGRVRRNMPTPIPVILLGRLAIDRGWQGRGLGADLLRDAVLRTIGAGETVGVRAMVVHAISEEARAFYERFGFKPSPVEALTLMLTLAEGRRALGEMG